ncbi:3'-phosphatase, 5'-polynucleotide kinase [Vibrio phage Vp_R1]|uniref:3'-phosphatase, 5'-polynucleotide kinase n=1 Tax=Vibrio phage Vp_R1 TaxID=2059867 RepID=A0A2H5BQQ9_9CAUD|nr:3'-phosphatase, 5'-polynucleotide kinase [Vibrio phage Vp_R1]AUG88496.1 3'-phosphatase, 5'-polynucleotide kinase [Vibrio phage Vp_R1]
MIGGQDVQMLKWYQRLPKAVIFDLDGTLSCGKHRLHLLPPKELAHINSSWDEFNLAAGADDPIEDNITILKALKDQDYKIIILTGRSATAKKVTEEWLDLHSVPYDDLIMRGSDDDRKDTVIKEEVLRGLMRFFHIVACFDDLEHVAKHIRSLGLTCHLVTHYDNKCLSTSSNGKGDD